MTQDYAEFLRLLDAYIDGADAERVRIEQEIDTRFKSDCAVLCLDMSGFTRTVRERGLVFYLAMIHRMNRIGRAVTPDFGGTVVKFDADNMTARFDNPRAAFQAGEALFEAFEIDNRDHSDAAHIKASIGIAYGPVVDVPGYDANGDAVNTASKLGEDIARAGDILIDDQAFGFLDESAQARFERLESAAASVPIKAWRRIRPPKNEATDA